MTFTIKLRGDQSGTVLHEYHCPVHGRFEADVPRASVPDAVPCPELCHEDGYDDGDGDGHPCRASSPWSPSAVTCRVKIAEVTRGKVEAPPTKNALDTRDLAEGMPMNEWRAKRAKLRLDERRKRNREMLR